MSETLAESNLLKLTDEQKEFLRQCEEDFVNRFTEDDPEYVEVRDRGRAPPPLEDPWNPIPFRDRNARDRPRFRNREFRERDGWRNRYGYDNYSRYDRPRDNYNRYNRTPYQSNYYRN